MSVVDVVGELSPPGIKNKVYGKTEYDKAQVVYKFVFGGGEGRGEGGYAQGGPNLPTPILSSLASSHTPFPLRDIKHCWVISPYFSIFLPFQNFHISLFSLPPPIPLPPLFFRA